MKVLVEAPLEAVQHVLDDFDLEYTLERRRADILIPDPLKWVQLYKYPLLKIIATPSTGTDHIPLDACDRHNIKVLSLLDNRDSLSEIRASSEYTFMLILMALRNGAFRQWNNYERDDNAMRGHELYEKRVGIVGMGRIGDRINHWVNAFGAHTENYDPYAISTPYRNLTNHVNDGLEHIFQMSDIVVICSSLTPETKGMITGELIKSMRPGAILVNTARGEIVNEAELVEVLRARKDTLMYATDVLAGESRGEHLKSPLLSMSNVIVTPHLAGTTFESQEKAMRITLELVTEHAE